MNYYFAKIRYDFFLNDEMRLLGSKGCIYQLIYLKMILLSVPTLGRLEFNGVPYDLQTLSVLLSTPITELEEVIQFLAKYRMILNENGTFLITGIEKYIGLSTSAKRMRAYRERKKQENSLTNKNNNQNNHKNNTINDSINNITSDVTSNIISDVTSDVTNNVTSDVYKIIENKIIDNKKKEDKRKDKRIQLPDWAIEYANLLLRLHQEIDPLFKVSNATINRWASDIEKIHRIDNRPINDIKEIIYYAKKNNFWSKNIISGEKLRKQFARLVAEQKKVPIEKKEEDTPLTDYYLGKISQDEMIRRMYGDEMYRKYKESRQGEI